MNCTGVMHMHSTHSYDGKVPLRELKELLIAEGISFACMTEHTDALTEEKAAAFVSECRELSDDSFVFVPGFEVPYKDAHILMIGTTQFFGQVAADAAALRAAASAASLTILAHPVRNQFELDDAMREAIDGVEVWNQQYEGKRVPRPRSYHLLETLRKEKPRLLATGGLDLHRSEHLTFPRVHLECASLKETDITHALKCGSYTFGHHGLMLPAQGAWKDANSVYVHLRSQLSVLVIVLGKFVNKTLAALGISLPKRLTRSIRSRV